MTIKHQFFVRYQDFKRPDKNTLNHRLINLEFRNLCYEAVRLIKDCLLNFAKIFFCQTTILRHQSEYIQIIVAYKLL